MLKLATGGFASRSIACVSASVQNNCKQLAPAGSAIQKNLSQSKQCFKKFIIKNHYEFDKKVINSEKPVIVDFHAEWCDPCKILTPKMTELLENSNDIDLAIIDVDSNTDIVETFEVQAVPAVLAFRNGVVVDKFIGLVDANSIEEIIKKLNPNAASEQSSKGTTA